MSAANVKTRSAGRNHKASLDIFWLKDESLADRDNLPGPEVIAQRSSRPTTGRSAIKVARPGAPTRVRPHPQAAYPAGRGSGKSRGKRSLGGAAIAVALLALGGSWLYSHVGGGRGGVSPATAGDVPPAES